MEPHARISDYLWAVGSVLAIGVVLVLVVPVFINLVRDFAWARLAAFLVGTFVICGLARWVIMGAWRRTVWGARAMRQR